MQIFGIDTGISLTGVGSSLSTTITFVLILIGVLIVGGFTTYFIYQWRVYNVKVERYENLAGRGFARTGIFKARRISSGDDGSEVLYVAGIKKLKSAYGKRIDIRTYAFAVGPDGIWYNFTYGDLDAKNGIMDIEFEDRDMSMANTYIRKNAQERYNKKTFMEQYGVWIYSFVLLAMLLIGGYFWIGQMKTVSESNTKAVEATVKVLEQTNNILARQDTLILASGLKPVGGV